MNTAVIPEGMHEVAKAEFFRRLMITTLNIHPRSEKTHTDWMIVGTHERWGWSSRGWGGPFAHQGGAPEVYALADAGGDA
jgi:hypothetical protein